MPMFIRTSARSRGGLGGHALGDEQQVDLQFPAGVEGVLQAADGRGDCGQEVPVFLRQRPVLRHQVGPVGAEPVHRQVHLLQHDEQPRARGCRPGCRRCRCARGRTAPAWSARRRATPGRHGSCRCHRRRRHSAGRGPTGGRRACCPGSARCRRGTAPAGRCSGQSRDFRLSRVHRQADVRGVVTEADADDLPVFADAEDQGVHVGIEDGLAGCPPRSPGAAAGPAGRGAAAGGAR